MSPAGPLQDSTVRELDRLARQAQHDWRAPGVSVGVMRSGRLAWSAHVGSGRLDPPTPANDDTQFLIGSVTKTFTAVVIMALRDEGKLSIDAPLATFLPQTRHGGVTIRQVLAHASGLQREPVGRIWEGLQPPDRDRLLRELEDAEQVLPAHFAFHYSNLAYALLGQVVASVRRAGWAELVDDALLRPLGLSRTTTVPTAPVARGYFTDPYADRLRPEPLFPGFGFAPAAELWSTPADLARWAAFWADPDPAVLAPATVAEMAHLHAMADLQQWTLGWGLGLMLHRRGERMLVGHDGAMPGFLAGMVVERDSGLAVVVLTNTSRAADPTGLALGLVDAVLDAVPDVPEPWRPATHVPGDVEDLLGAWWAEGVEWHCSWRRGDDPAVDAVEGGHLELRSPSAPASKPPAVLCREGRDRWRVVSGREQGELVRVVRDGFGAAQRLSWATYPMTRDPLPFGE